jgi:hypothetical protein
MDKLAEIGQGLSNNVRTASATKSVGPRMTPQMPMVDRGGVQGSVRNLSQIAESRNRSAEQAIAKAKDMVAKKASELSLNGADILFLRADISRWDDKSGEPQTGRIAFQIPFKSPHGDPRTIYANVDLVMGDVLAPQHFQDGLNNKYAFDSKGLDELLRGKQFEIIHNPHVEPETKYRGPDMFPPSDIPGAVAGAGGRGGFRLMRTAGAGMVRTASKTEPQKRACEGLIRPISRETMEAKAQPVAMPPTSPEEMAELMERHEKKKQTSHAPSIYPSGAEETKPYVGEQHGGDQIPAASTLAKTQGQEKVAASGKGMNDAVECLLNHDVRMVEFKDLVRILKQFGHTGDVDYGQAAKRLMQSGIVLYRSAGTVVAKSDLGNVFRAMAMDSRRKIEAQNAPPDFEISRYLEPVEYKEYQATLDKWTSIWADIVEREKRNMEEGRPAHAGIDYSEVQIIADTIKAMQNKARTRYESDSMPAPADVSIEDETMPKGPTPGEGPGAAPGSPGGGAIEPATMMPEKGMAVPASARYQMVRKAGVADDIREKVHRTKRDLSRSKEHGFAAPGTKGHGRHKGYPKSEGKMPEFAKKAVQPKDFPPVCNNCKHLICPSEYCPLSEFKSTRLPFCGAAKSHLVGFEYAWFRECDAYDPIVKGIPQKIDVRSTESQQTKEDVNKVRVPINQKAEGEDAEAKALLDDLFGYMDMFTYKENIPEYEHNVEVQNKVGDALKNPADQAKVTEALQAMASFLELFVEDYGDSDTGEPELIARIEKVLGGMGKGNPKSAAIARRHVLERAAAIGSAVMQEMAQAIYGKPLDQLTWEEYHVLVQAVGDEGPKQSQPHVLEEVAVGDAEIEKKATSGEAQDWISKKIKFLMENEGLSQDQAVGKAHGMAKQKFPSVPDKKAEALPSAAPESVREKVSPTGHGRAVREWCRKNKCYAPAGEHHPVHDWCTFWNTACENLVLLPSGSVVPRSMAFQTSEVGGEGGPHQFMRSPNQNG